MLKFTIKSQQKQQKQKQIEINKIVKNVSDIEKNFALPFAIKRLSEKRKKTQEEEKTLDTLLAMHMNQAKNQEVQVPTPSDVKVMDQLKEIQVPTPSGVEVIDQLQKVQVKPLPTPSGLGVTDELAKKVAKRRALLDEQDNINTGNVSYSKEIIVATESVNTKKTSQKQASPLAERSLNQKDIQKQPSQTVKQAVNSDNSAPLNHGLNVIEELARTFAKRKEISKRNNNDTTEKDKVISSTTNVSSNEQSKLFEQAAVEVQIQKNVDIDLRQNSDEGSFLLQLKAARQQLINNQTTVQEDNLPYWVKSEFIDSAEEKKLEEKKEQDLFNFSEIVCDRTDLSEEEIQEIINFREQVCNVELRLGNEADKKRFENTVSKIVEEITRPNSIIVKEISRPNSIFDDEFNNNLKTINEFIKENDTQQQPQNLLSLHFKSYTQHEPVIVEMIPKLNFK